jgi:hypothetical protein
MTHEPPTKANPPPPHRRFKKRYAVAAASLLGSLGVMFDVVQVRVQLHPVPGFCFVVPLEAARLPLAGLPKCDGALANTNALDAKGEEVWCEPPMGWVRDAGELGLVEGSTSL